MSEIGNRYQEKQVSGLKYGIIEVTTKCQFRCPGCYMVRRNMLGKKEMTLEQAVRILDLCKDYRGSELETMDILGGEPLLWPFLKEYIEVLLKRGILPWIFTNMVLINPEMAKWLFERGVHITGKLNISNPNDPEQLKLQAEMIGVKNGIARKMIDAIDIFQQAGYRDPLFRLQNLVRKKNLALIPGYIMYCRSREIGVDFEIMGSGEPVDDEYFKIAPTAQELAELIVRLDSEGVIISPKEKLLMPHVFGSCPFYDKGLYFAVDGHIRACSNSTIVLAWITDNNPVKKAYESPLICDRLKLTQQVVGEPCNKCDRWEKCRGGCRATVEGMGDPFGGYTLCPLPFL
jgi:radical SAM protein with 4Fe4S-binding SPASM domain